MGYTNYWKFRKPLKEISDYDNKMQNAVDLFKEGLVLIGNKVSYDSNKYRYDFAKDDWKDMPFGIAGGNGIGEPILWGDDKAIFFNGKQGYGCCEDFLISENSWCFCKTCGEPYDIAVCLMLYCIKYYFGKDFSFSNDGDGWSRGRGLARKVMNRLTKGK